MRSVAIAFVLCSGFSAGIAVADTPPPEVVALMPRADVLATPGLLAGAAAEPVSYLHYELDCLCVTSEAHVALDTRVGSTSAFALDRMATPSTASAAISPRARVHLVIAGPKSPVRWEAEYEQDLPTGTLSRTTASGLDMPDSEGISAPLRRASVRAIYGKVIAGGGFTMSHWGLGLVANDGDHGWEPGSARVADPRGGDRVLRGYVATGPYTSKGLVLAVAAEHVLDDEALLTSHELGGKAGDDDANQAIATATIGHPAYRWAGAYVAYRSQQSADGRSLHATVLDASAIHHQEIPGGIVMAGAELAYVRGDTSLAPTIAHAKESVAQLGAAVRGAVDFGRWGAAFDGLYASGDDNLDDGQEHGFHANHNYELGLILFRQVLAAQTARGAATASDPQLVGQPIMGYERIPTRGAATNTIAVFPRAFVRPTRGVEIYGGPLLAWSATSVIDPFNTTVAGGAPTNALGGSGGRFLGAELDVGVRARFLAWGSEVGAGFEAGAFAPGSALADAMGHTPGTITSARVMLGVRL